MRKVEENIGKICVSLEKFFNTETKKLEVKKRPVLIIGHEREYNSPFNVDYELLPLSKIENTTPDEYYDIQLDYEKIKTLNLNYLSYIRSHKTTWNHCKHLRIEEPISDLKKTYPELFEEILEKNLEWVQKRTLSYLPSKQLEA